MQAKTRLENITIVLNRPKYSGNVGSVARLAKNMGIEKLVVVGHNNLNEEEMKTKATHKASEIVDGIKYFDNIDEALSEFNYIVGTTSRVGRARGPVVTPKEMAKQLVSISCNNEIALLFGSEDIGLSNDELRFCHLLVTIPASEHFTSLNLSHAVMILCYELFSASMNINEPFIPRLATSAELESMYEHIHDVLIKIGFLNPQNPYYWMMHLRRFFSRTKLYSRDVKIIRGICRQIDWYVKDKKT